MRGKVRNQAFACAVYEVLNDIEFFFGMVRHQVRELSEITIPGKEHGVCKRAELPVQDMHPIRLHGMQIHRFGSCILGASPRRTRKQLKLLGQRRQPQAVVLGIKRRGPGLGRQILVNAVLAAPEPEQQFWAQRPGRVFQALDNVEAVGVDPGDVLVNAVDARIVLGAGQGACVALDGDDVGPGAVSGKGDGVAACAGEHVDYDAGWVFFGGGLFGEVVCDLPFWGFVSIYLHPRVHERGREREMVTLRWARV